MAYASKIALNVLSGRHIIGQSETHHSCLNLPLTICSEKLVGVRISGWTKLRKQKVKYCDQTKDFLTQYYLRKNKYDMSLWQYFQFIHNKADNIDKLSISYAMGSQCTPVFPVTASYAKACLIKHKPWSKQNMLIFTSDAEAIEEFSYFFDNNLCPQFLKSELIRLKTSYNNKTRTKESTHSKINPVNNKNDLGDGNVDEAVSAMMSFSRTMKYDVVYEGTQFDRGIHYPWSDRLSTRDPNLDGENWLFNQIDNYNADVLKNGSKLTIPLKKDRTHYGFSDLNNDQCQIAYMVMNKIIEWIEYPMAKNDQHQYSFSPLRMTIKGKAGTGKGFLINSLISMVRKLTNINESVIICGPTC